MTEHMQKPLHARLPITRQSIDKNNASPERASQPVKRARAERAAGPEPATGVAANTRVAVSFNAFQAPVDRCQQEFPDMCAAIWRMNCYLFVSFCTLSKARSARQVSLRQLLIVPTHASRQGLCIQTNSLHEALTQYDMCLTTNNARERPAYPAATRTSERSQGKQAHSRR
jgi:hypothetical protein